MKTNKEAVSPNTQEKEEKDLKVDFDALDSSKQEAITDHVEIDDGDDTSEHRAGTPLPSEEELKNEAEFSPEQIFEIDWINENIEGEVEM